MNREDISRYVQEKALKGTTTVAVICSDGVVVGADTRVTAGTFIAHKRGKKIFSITPRIAITIAGLLADAQAIIDTLKYNIRLYELRNRRRMDAKSAARMLSYILFQNRLYPLYTELIVSGMDGGEFSLYRLDLLGSLVKDEYSSTGSGSPLALGVLENGYKKDITVGEGIELVAQSLAAAMSRDIGSGNDFDILVMDESGSRELRVEEKGQLIRKHLGMVT